MMPTSWADVDPINVGVDWVSRHWAALNQLAIIDEELAELSVSIGIIRLRNSATPGSVPDWKLLLQEARRRHLNEHASIFYQELSWLEYELAIEGGMVDPYL